MFGSKSAVKEKPPHPKISLSLFIDKELQPLPSQTLTHRKFPLESNLQIKQFENPLLEPVTYHVTSKLFPSNVTISDRYNDFPNTKEAHLDMLFFGRRRGWHLNKLDLDK